MSHAVAAALPLAGLTAWQALVDHAGVRAGESVLVHGGAGGVGALTVQLAAMLGARVTATVRSDAGDLVRGYGAARVIDVRTEGFDDAVYDVVIDTVGARRWTARFRLSAAVGDWSPCRPHRRPAEPTNTASRQSFSSSRRTPNS